MASMNLGEKRRAEQMVVEAVISPETLIKAPKGLVDALTKAKAAQEAANQKVHDAEKALRDSGFQLTLSWVDGGNVSIREWLATPNHPDRKAERDKVMSERDRLIAEIWNGDHTFETLKAELDRITK